MLGSHNSMSYLKPIKWYQKILNKWSKCQNVSLIQQYAYGAHYFDLRIKLINNEWHFVHNKIDYGEVICNLNDIKDLNCIIPKGDKLYIRIVLDERKKPYKEEYKNEEYKNKFFKFTEDLNKLTIFNNLFISSIIVFWEWKDYKLINNIKVTECHASVSAKWYEYLFLGIKKFAEKYNEKFIENNKFISKADIQNEVLLLDYINSNNRIKY